MNPLLPPKNDIRKQQNLPLFSSFFFLCSINFTSMFKNIVMLQKIEFEIRTDLAFTVFETWRKTALSKMALCVAGSPSVSLSSVTVTLYKSSDRHPNFQELFE